MRKERKVLYIDNTSSFGGAINSLMYLLKGIDKEKFSPVIVTGQPEDVLEDVFSNYTYYRVRPNLPWIHNSFLRNLISIPFFHKHQVLKKAVVVLRHIYWVVLYDIPESFRYYKIGKRHNVCIIHLNNMFGGQFAGIIAAKLLNVPCVAHLRDFESIGAIPKYYAKLIDHHIAISFSIKENLKSLAVPEEKITVVHDAIDTDFFNDTVSSDHLSDEFQLTTRNKVFAIFGRIAEWKGIKEFIFASRIVCQEIPEAKAFIVGGPSDKDQQYFHQAKELARQLGLEDKVIFTGYRKDIPALMKRMDIVVHASITPEPFGMVLIEAMAMGKPVVATKAGGPLDIVIDGETGYLVEMGEPREMADKIIHLLRDSDLCKEMGQKGRGRVISHFTKERYARQVEEIYESVLGGA